MFSGAFMPNKFGLDQTNSALVVWDGVDQRVELWYQANKDKMRHVNQNAVNCGFNLTEYHDAEKLT